MEAFNIYNNIFCQAELLKLFEQIFSFINGENAHNSLINRIGLTDVDNTIDVLEVMYIIYIYFKEIFPESLYGPKSQTCLNSFIEFVKNSYSILGKDNSNDKVNILKEE